MKAFKFNFSYTEKVTGVVNVAAEDIEVAKAFVLKSVPPVVTDFQLTDGAELSEEEAAGYFERQAAKEGASEAPSAEVLN